MKPCALLVLSLLASTVASSQTLDSALKSMVETERAFSQMSFDKGTRDAFLAFIADDGILFRPTAVKGKEWMLANPLPATTKRSLLSWQPVFADIAQSADMGYTTGPWQFKADINDQQPTAFGEFITVWRKQRDGSWKYAIDLGISHAEPSSVTSFQSAPIQALKNTKAISSSTALSKIDQELSNESANRGAEAFLSRSADNVRVFRNSNLPFIGREAAAKAITNSTIWTWKPAFADVAASGDLGYTYGSYWRKDKNRLVEQGNYLRIWRNVNGEWQVVVDVADPQPHEEKKN